MKLTLLIKKKNLIKWKELHGVTMHQHRQCPGSVLLWVLHSIELYITDGWGWPMLSFG